MCSSELFLGVRMIQHSQHHASLAASCRVGRGRISSLLYSGNKVQREKETSGILARELEFEVFNHFMFSSNPSSSPHDTFSMRLE